MRCTRIVGCPPFRMLRSTYAAIRGGNRITTALSFGISFIARRPAPPPPRPSPPGSKHHAHWDNRSQCTCCVDASSTTNCSFGVGLGSTRATAGRLSPAHHSPAAHRLHRTWACARRTMRRAPHLRQTCAESARSRSAAAPHARRPRARRPPSPSAQSPARHAPRACWKARSWPCRGGDARISRACARSPQRARRPHGPAPPRRAESYDIVDRDSVSFRHVTVPKDDATRELLTKAVRPPPPRRSRSRRRSRRRRAPAAAQQALPVHQRGPEGD